MFGLSCVTYVKTNWWYAHHEHSRQEIWCSGLILALKSTSRRNISRVATTEPCLFCYASIIRLLWMIRNLNGFDSPNRLWGRGPRTRHLLVFEYQWFKSPCWLGRWGPWLLLAFKSKWFGPQHWLEGRRTYRSCMRSYRWSASFDFWGKSAKWLRLRSNLIFDNPKVKVLLRSHNLFSVSVFNL